MSSTPPWTKRRPRLTWVSEGKDFRRLRVISKAGEVVDIAMLHDTPPLKMRPPGRGYLVAREGRSRKPMYQSMIHLLPSVSFDDTGFKDRVTEAVLQGESPKGFPPDLVKVARRKLGYLDAAVDLRDLRVPPGTGSKRLAATAADNIRSGSTTNSGFASDGRRKDRPKLK